VCVKESARKPIERMREPIERMRGILREKPTGETTVCVPELAHEMKAILQLNRQVRPPSRRQACVYVAQAAEERRWGDREWLAMVLRDAEKLRVWRRTRRAEDAEKKESS
jgi:hypothetical protein